jgi:hypothetical protein
MHEAEIAQSATIAHEGGHRIVGGFDAMSDVLSEGLRNPKD